MKIVHICLSGYLDNWGYQENLLPEYMALAGHDVTIVSSSNHFPSFVTQEERRTILSKGKSYNVGNVKVCRINVYITTSQYQFVVIGLLDLLKKEKPDVIFHHDINGSSMIICWLYCVMHSKVKLFFDNHADAINQSSNKLWNVLVPHGIMRVCTKLVQHRVHRFYGVTPGRCDYLNSVFGVDKNKISLFPIGADINAVNVITSTSKELRVKYGIPVNDNVIVSGGKMGIDKGTMLLIKSCMQLRESGQPVSLVLFGRFIDNETKLLAEQTDNVYFEGWCNRNKTLEILKLADIACWPILHTTLIEDSIAVGVPLVINKTPNTSHSILENGEFIQQVSVEQLYYALNKVFVNYSQYKDGAETMRDRFNYFNLVKQFEQDCNE